MDAAAAQCVAQRRAGAAAQARTAQAAPAGRGQCGRRANACFKQLVTLRLRLLNKRLLLKLALLGEGSAGDGASTLDQHLVNIAPYRPNCLSSSCQARAVRETGQHPRPALSQQSVQAVLVIKPALLSSSCGAGAAREAGPHLLTTIQRAMSTECLFNAALSISAEEVVLTVDVRAKL